MPRKVKPIKLQEEGTPLASRSIEEIFEIKERLVDALSAGASIKASCKYAHITEKDFESIVAKSPEIQEVYDDAESVLGVQAMINVKNDINDGKMKTTKWYLEKVMPDKFGKKLELNPVVVPVEEKAKAWSEALDKITND